jgi:hypothetical protein
MKLFGKFAWRERISDASLTEAIERAGRGLVDADLAAASSSKGWRGQGKGVRAAIAR